MAVQDEIFRIRYQAEGQAAIRNAQDEIRKLEAAAKQLAASYKGMPTHQFAAQTDALAQQLARARANLDGFQQAAKGGAGGRNLGMAALEAGRALEDLNFGLLGVINNVPQLAMALGAGAGLTGVIATLGAAALFLSRNWGTVADTLKLGIPNETISSLQRTRSELDEINAALDAIASKPRISIAEKIQAGTLKIKREDLERQLGEAQAVEDVFGGNSDREQEVAKVVSDVIRNSGMERRDITSLIARGAGGNDAGKSLLGRALQGDESAALGLSRALGADGTNTVGANLGRSLRVGLAGNPSAAEYGPDRGVMEEGLARMAAPIPEQAGAAMADAYREMQGDIAADARSAMRANGGEFGPDRGVMEAGLRDQQLRQIMATMPPGALSPRGVAEIGLESLNQTVQSAGAKDPAQNILELVGWAEKQYSAIEDVKRAVERFGGLGA